MNTSSLDVAELAAQAMILPLYGSSPASVIAEQAAANQSIYGLDTPAEIIAELRPGGVRLPERIPFHPKFGELALGSLGESQRFADFTTGLQDVAHS